MFRNQKLSMLVAFAIAAMVVFASPSSAHRWKAKPEKVCRSAVGFHNTAAPVGARIALDGRYSLDVGIGFKSGDGFDATTFDAGIPVTVKRFGVTRVLLRPGILYESRETAAGDVNTTTLSAEVEGEAFIAKRFSVSASFGVAQETVDPPVGDDVVSFRSAGGEFTRVGFHLYLF